MAWEATKGEHAKTAVCTRQTGTPVYYKFTTTGETGYVFVGWYDQQGGLVSTQQSLSCKESSYPSGLTLTARWGKAYTHSVTRTNPDYSTIVGTPSRTVYFIDGVCVRGEDLSVTVAAKAGKIFTGWSGDTQYATIDGGTCEISKDVERRVAVNAGFAEAATVTLAYDIGDGTSTPPPSESQTVAKGANAVFTLAAAPTAPLGHHFTGWTLSTDSSSYAPREAGSPVSIKASATRTVTATANYEEYGGYAITTQAKYNGVDVQKFITLSPPENAHNANMEVSGWLPQTPMTVDAAEVLYDEQNYAKYRFVNWTATGGVTLTTPNEHLTRFTMQSADVTLTANYVLKPLNVAAEVDSGSVGKVTASLVVTRVVDGQTVTVRGTSEDPFRYGDTATFTATVATGYSFGGWYATGSDNTPRFSTLQYSMMLKEDTVLVAKASVRVEFSWPDATPYVSHGPLSINGERFQNGLASAVLAIGSTAEIKAELTSGEFTGFSVDGESKDFTRWSEGVYVANITVPDAPTPLPQDYVATVSIVAGWSATIETYYVALYAQNGNATPAEFSEDGAFSLTGNGVEEIVGTTEPAKTAAEVYEDLMRAKYGDENFEALSDLGRFFKVTGAQNVVIGVYAVGNRPLKDFDRWEKYEPPQQSEGGEQDDEEQESEETDYGLPPAGAAPDAEYPKSIDGDYIGVATFKIGDTYTVRIKHEAPDSATIAQGSLDMGGFTSIQYASDRYWLEGTFRENTTATVTARPANGYKFKCWKENGSVLAGWGAQHSFVPSQNRILVAEFEEDSVGILLWEGSDENMEVEWTSKVYVAPKPFDPVAARVDARGYPVSLDVGTMSSPNAKPTRPHPIEVASQDGRRLPRMRPERFVRFTVKASCEIDAVVIGTNMAEVN